MFGEHGIKIRESSTPFKVRCVDAKYNHYLVADEVYTVINVSKECGVDYYDLAGLEGHSFFTQRFVKIQEDKIMASLDTLPLGVLTETAPHLLEVVHEGKFITNFNVDIRSASLVRFLPNAHQVKPYHYKTVEVLTTDGVIDALKRGAKLERIVRGESKFHKVTNPQWTEIVDNRAYWREVVEPKDKVITASVIEPLTTEQLKVLERNGTGVLFAPSLTSSARYSTLPINVAIKSGAIVYETVEQAVQVAEALILSLKAQAVPTL